LVRETLGREIEVLTNDLGVAAFSELVCHEKMLKCRGGVVRKTSWRGDSRQFTTMSTFLIVRPARGIHLGIQEPKKLLTDIFLWMKELAVEIESSRDVSSVEENSAPTRD